MRRSRHSRGHSKKEKRSLLLIIFTIGVAIGLLSLILYKVSVPKIYKIKIEKKPIAYPKKITPPPPRIAIVLDDFGYNYKNVEAVFNLKTPVTFSILPHHPYSKTISRRVHEQGYEAILHLPLQPAEKERAIKPELNTITVSMKKEEVLEILNKVLEDVAFIKGVSGHQGSKATEDRALMRAIFGELKKRNLFFLDSLVTDKSVCKQIAKEIGIKFIRRDVFLDNKEDFEYIKGQTQQLIRRAKRQGFAVGIGHDRADTVSALAKLMPDAKKEGVEFVFLSELIK